MVKRSVWRRLVASSSGTSWREVWRALNWSGSTDSR
jgi:hypothetical protein